MGYCVFEDVQKHRPQHPITATSRPSIGQIEANIDNLSAEVDGRVAALGFIVPVTGEISLRYLQAAVSYGVACFAEMQQRAGIAERDTAPRSFYCERWDAMIRAIEENAAILADAPRTDDPTLVGAEGAVIESFFTVNPTDDPHVGQLSRMEGTAVQRFRIDQQF